MMPYGSRIFSQRDCTRTLNLSLSLIGRWEYLYPFDYEENEARLAPKRFYSIKFLPRKIKVITSEVTICSSLLIYRASELKVINDRLRS